MSAASGRSFASVLDQLMNAEPVEPQPAGVVPPSLGIDALGTASPVDALWSSVPDEFVADLYLGATEEQTAVPEPFELPSVRGEDIARELGLDRASAKNLDRLRRVFAFKNHPDRVAPELRHRALLRMQVANRLIDEAKRKTTAKG
jgi:hypothetical protein